MICLSISQAPFLFLHHFHMNLKITGVRVCMAVPSLRVLQRRIQAASSQGYGSLPRSGSTFSLLLQICVESRLRQEGGVETGDSGEG